MSAAVKYLTKKVAKAEVESAAASKEAKKAHLRADECRERAWQVREELGAAVDADIAEAKAALPA